MTLTEALTLAREKPGVKVAPLCYRGSGTYIVFDKCKDFFVKRNDEAAWEGFAHLSGVEELLGPWEVLK